MSSIHTEPRDIIILGAGGLAREVAYLIEEINHQSEVWRLLGYIDQDSDRVGTIVGNYPIMATETEISDWNCSAVIAIGAPSRIQAIRRRICAYPGLNFPNLVHPSVIWDAASINIGEGNIICAGAILNVDITIGSFNILNMNSSYGHDVIVEDCCVIGPGVGIGGGAVVGNGSLIGMGAQIYQYSTIGECATVGLGSAVTSDVPSNTTVIGVPARPLLTNSQSDQNGGILE
jgi:sugar O-acyltransferase (sialic acid O-acetyltransferase NeuD family)